MYLKSPILVPHISIARLARNLYIRINLFYIDSVNINYVNFEFEIQHIYICYRSNDDSVHTIIVYKIYSLYC